MKLVLLTACSLLLVSAAAAYTPEEIAQKIIPAFDAETGGFADGAEEVLLEVHGMIQEALAEDIDEPGYETAYKSLNVVVMYNLACLSALDGETEEAFQWLSGAVEAGYSDPEWMEEDPDLESLHEDPRFQELLDAAEEHGCGDCTGCGGGCH